MLAKPQGFPRKLGGCAGLDPRLRSAVSAGVGDGERGLRRGLRAPGVGVRPKWVLEYSPSNKRIRYFVSITMVAAPAASRATSKDWRLMIVSASSIPAPLSLASRIWSINSAEWQRVMSSSDAGAGLTCCNRDQRDRSASRAPWMASRRPGVSGWVPVSWSRKW